MEIPRLSIVLFCVSLITLQSCIIIPPTKSSKETRKPAFEQVDFQDLINRYMKKGGSQTIEGVYSVSSTVTKKGKNLTGVVREKTTDRKENYATVAILREQGKARDYIELSLNKKNLPSYSVVGEFNAAATGGILVYKHFEPKNKTTSYTFTRDENSDVLEGVCVKNEGNTQVTYKLMYVKLTQK